jgi:hypothetical protein
MRGQPGGSSTDGLTMTEALSVVNPLVEKARATV